MTSHFLFGLIKLLMMSAPFLSMVMMILSLWGVVGKASYPDLAVTQQGSVFDDKEAKNYLVNETKKIEQCPEEFKSADIVPKGENPMPEKIDWEHAV